MTDCESGIQDTLQPQSAILRSDPPMADITYNPRFSSPSTRANAISNPSGDHDVNTSFASGVSVSLRSASPSIGFTHMSAGCRKSGPVQVNAMKLPSGENAGAPSRPGYDVAVSS